jgi:hypothetical protein
MTYPQCSFVQHTIHDNKMLLDEPSLSCDGTDDPISSELRTLVLEYNNTCEQNAKRRKPLLSNLASCGDSEDLFWRSSQVYTEKYSEISKHLKEQERLAQKQVELEMEGMNVSEHTSIIV